MRPSLGLAPGQIRFRYIRAAKAVATALEKKNAGIPQPDLPTLLAEWARSEETFADAGYRTYPLEGIEEQPEKCEREGMVGTRRNHGEEAVLYANQYAEANPTLWQRQA